MIFTNRQEERPAPGTLADIENALLAGYRIHLRRVEVERPLFVAEMFRANAPAKGTVSPLRSETIEGLCREIRHFVTDF